MLQIKIVVLNYFLTTFEEAPSLQTLSINSSLTLHFGSSEQDLNDGYNAVIESVPKTSTNLAAASIPLNYLKNTLYELLDSNLS